MKRVVFPIILLIYSVCSYATLPDDIYCNDVHRLNLCVVSVKLSKDQVEFINQQKYNFNIKLKPHHSNFLFRLTPEELKQIEYQDKMSQTDEFHNFLKNIKVVSGGTGEAYSIDSQIIRRKTYALDCRLSTSKSYDSSDMNFSDCTLRFFF